MKKTISTWGACAILQIAVLFCIEYNYLVIKRLYYEGLRLPRELFLVDATGIHIIVAILLLSCPFVILNKRKLAPQYVWLACCLLDTIILSIWISLLLEPLTRITYRMTP